MSNISTIGLSETNCYLIRMKTGFCLVDCANRCDGKRLKKAIGRKGVSLSEIRFLVLTHHHADHCGLLHFLTAANPQIRLIMSKKCAEYLQTGNNCVPVGERYANAALSKFIEFHYYIHEELTKSGTPFFVRPNDIVIEEDTILDEYGLNGKILMTPGHTMDSLSLLVGDAAFVGDAARNMLNFTGTPYQPILYYDLAACYNSWYKLIQCHIQTIYPSHGKPFPVEKLPLPKALYR